MNIWSVSAGPLHTPNGYSFISTWPLHTPNEYAVGIHLTPAYTQSISDQYPPDSCIHPINIQLVTAWPIHTPNEYPVGICLTPAYIQWIFSRYPPGTSIHLIHTQSVSTWPLHRRNEYPIGIRLTLPYTQVNIRSVSTIHTFIICYIWYPPKTFVMLIEYLMGNNQVIWSLCQAVHLTDSIRYSISNIKTSYTGLLLVRHVIYTYWISFRQPV